MAFKTSVIFFLLALIGLVFNDPAVADLDGVEPMLNCGSDFIWERTKTSHPDIYEQQLILEEQRYDLLTQNVIQLRSNNPVVLPVVVHILHNNGNENVSDALVQQGIDHLNAAFANQGFYDRGTGVNTEIQFCLAQQDPEGNATSGINRILSPFETNGMEEDDLATKDLIRWDPRSYINVWLVREICSSSRGCNVAGYAYLPGAHGGRFDGIVMEARWMGSSPSNSNVLVHEMGHYLGLRHTFNGGCKNDDCLRDGDQVCDTPPDQSTAGVPCDDPSNSCTTDTDSGLSSDEDDMIENYMDYGRFSCYSAFTQGQVDRMHFFIQGRRRSLLESIACAAPCLVDVDVVITPGDTVTVNVGDPANFTAAGQNVTTFQWYRQNEALSTGDILNTTFDQVGNYWLRVRAGNDQPGCFKAEDTVLVKVVCPVIADFIADTTQILEGETLNFTNTSQNAVQYQWLVNGDSVGNTVNLAYTFDESGVYSIWLVADNNKCEDMHEQFVVVRSLDDCSPEIQQLEIPGLSEVDKIIVTGDNSILGIGRRTDPDRLSGYNYLLFKLNAGKELVWSKLLDDLFVSVYWDSDMVWLNDHLYVVAFESSGGENSVLLFKLDEAGEMIWTRNFLKNSSQVSTQTELITLSDDHLVLGIENDTDQTLFYKIATDGSIVWSKGFREFELFDLEKNNQNGFYAHGIVSKYIGSGFTPNGLAITRTLLKFDENGSLIWGKNYGFYNPTNPNGFTSSQLARSSLTVNDEGGVLFNFFDFANAMGADQVRTAVAYTDIDGNVLWAKNWPIFSDFTGTNSLAKDQNGNYKILKDPLLDNQAYLFTVDAKGNLLEQNCYDQEILSTLFVNANNQLFLGGATSNGTGILLFGDERGFAGECNLCFVQQAVAEVDLAVEDETLDEFSPELPTAVNRTLSNLPIRLEPVCYDRYYPDAALYFDTAEPCGDSLAISFRICNEGNLDLPANTPNIVVVPPTPAIMPVFPGVLPPDSCFEYQAVIPFGNIGMLDTVRMFGAANSTSYFWIVNDQEGDRRPNPFIFECNFDNNYSDLMLAITDRSSRPFDLGQDTLLCVDQKLLLSATDHYVDYRWQDGSTDSTFLVQEAGTYSVTATGICGDQFTDDITVIYNDDLTLNLGPDTTVCANGVMTFEVSGDFQQYRWPDGSTDRTFTAWEPGKYWVEATDACGNSQVDTVELNIEPSSIIDLGPDTLLCDGDALELIAPPGFDDYQWYTSSPIGCDTCRSIVIQPDTTAVYTVVATRTNGCVSSDSLTVMVGRGASMSDTVFICAGDSIEWEGNFFTSTGIYQTEADACGNNKVLDLRVFPGLTVEVEVVSSCIDSDGGYVSAIINGGLSPYQMNWSFTDDTDSIQYAVPEGDHNLVVTDANGCVVSYPFVVNPSTISITTGQRNIQCASENGGSIFVEQLNVSGLQFSLDGMSYQTEPRFDDLPPGDYTLYIKDEADCMLTENFTILDLSSEFLLALPAQVVIDRSDSIRLQPEIFPEGDYVYEWLPAIGLSCTDCFSPIASPESTTNYTMTATDLTGCTKSASVEIEVIEPQTSVYLPNAFSPNGDDINDFFNLYTNDDILEISYLRIFDRWGEMVFEEKAITPQQWKGWNGSFQGKKAIQGVYVYVAKIVWKTQEVEVLSGEVLLIR